jgi:putative resolvase
LSDPTVTTIVVEHRDRLARFGVEYIEATLSAQGRTLLVLHDDEVADDLVRDMIEVMTSLCARLYGQRSARRRAAAAVTVAADHP